MVRAVLASALAGVVLIAPAQALAAARPVIPGAAILGNAQILIHYPAGDPDGAAGAAQALSVVQEVRDRFVAATGMPQPLSDGATDPSADARFDVYLLADDGNYTASDHYGSISVDGDPAFLAIAHSLWSRGAATKSIAHEYVHASQLGIDQGEYGPEAWWAEATANWGASRTEGLQFDGAISADDFLRHGNGDLGAVDAGPMICNLPTYCGWFPWVSWLGDVYGQDIVSAIWQRQKALGAGVYGSHARQAIDAELAARGTTLPQTFLSWTAIAPFLRYAPFDAALPDPLKFRPCLVAGTSTQSYDVVDWGYRDLAYRVAGCPNLTGATSAQITVAGTGAADAHVTTWDGSSAPAAISPAPADQRASFTVPLVPAPAGFAVVIPDPGSGASRHADITVSVPVASPPARDTTPPRAVVANVGCARHGRRPRLCRIHGFTADQHAPVSGVARVDVSVSRSLGHRRCLSVHSSGRIVRGSCAHVPWLHARLYANGSGGWSRAVRLSRGRWTVGARAVDRAGNVQAKPDRFGKSVSR